MTEPRANAYLHACFMLVVGIIATLTGGPLGPWLGIAFTLNGVASLLVAWRASDESLARLQRRWFINPIETWRVLRGK